MTRVVAIVQARMGSSRLPGKSMAPLAGRPMLAHVLERAKAIRGVQVVLATSQADRDTPLTWIADDCRVGSYRGSEHDVLGRFAEIADGVGARVVMRLTGDCPLLDPEVCERVLADFAAHADVVDYVSNDTTCSGYPDGTDCEVFSARILRQAFDLARVHTDREHVTPWIRRHGVQRTVAAPADWARWKLSVDCADDLARVRRVSGFIPAGDYRLETTIEACRLAEGAGT